MKNWKFAARLLLFLFGSQSCEQRPNYRGLIRSAGMNTSVLMWPYLSQFPNHSSDFAYLDLIYNAPSRYVIQIKITNIKDLCDVIALELYIAPSLCGVPLKKPVLCPKRLFNFN